MIRGQLLLQILLLCAHVPAYPVTLALQEVLFPGTDIGKDQ